MKFYLSSYGLGGKSEDLIKMLPDGNLNVAYIPNALDFSKDYDRRILSEKKDLDELSQLGLNVERINLSDYFDNKADLEDKLSLCGLIWVRGGNVFVLRQAMKLSGMDDIIKNSLVNSNLVYGGYSAGVCVLAPNLKGLDIIDDITPRVYGDRSDLIWDGLDVIGYSIIPHYQSDHRESESASKAIDYMIGNKIPFIALKDGEVLIL